MIPSDLNIRHAICARPRRHQSLFEAQIVPVTIRPRANNILHHDSCFSWTRLFFLNFSVDATAERDDLILALLVIT